MTQMAQIRKNLRHLRLNSLSKRQLEVGAGFEIRAVGAHELAFLLIELCPAIRAGSFDLFDVRGITYAGRHAAYRLAVLYRSIRRGVQGSWLHRPPADS